MVRNSTAKTVADDTKNIGVAEFGNALSIEQVLRLADIGYPDVTSERRMLPQYGFIHCVSHIAVREMARGRGAKFGDVESFGQVHLEKSALAKGHGQQVGGGFRSRPGLDLMQGRNGPLHDLSVTVAETGGCHIRRRVMAVQMRETLFYLSAAAMTVHVAKPAKVPENIEAHGGAGMKSAQ